MMIPGCDGIERKKEQDREQNESLILLSFHLAAQKAREGQANPMEPTIRQSLELHRFHISSRLLVAWLQLYMAI